MNKELRMKKHNLLAAMMLIIAPGALGQIQPEAINIPRGPAVTLDGTISPGEWDHAARIQITVMPDWTVTALLQHDDKNLYVAFIELRHSGSERYPEVLLDPANQKPLLWKEGQQWWLHASYNLCESNARPNQYADCTPTKSGWAATRFPLKSGVSEIAISLDKVGLSPAKPFGLALDVTDTKGQWSFWPASAKLKVPVSWQTAKLQ
jgi:hypothetical protein